MYYLILFLILFLYLLIKDKKIYTKVVGIILVLFAGLRGTFVGPDTFQYQWIFEDIQRYHDVVFQFFFMSSDSDDQTSEPGYAFFQYVFGLIGDYNLFKFVCAIIQTVPAIRLIQKYSDNKLVSMIAYFCLPVYTMMSMSMMRQGLAFGIFLLAYQYILERKLWKYVCCVLLAFLFHTSALVTLPLYFLYSVPYKKKYNWIILLGLAFTFVFSRALYSFFISFARIQYEMSDSMEGIKMLLFLIVCILSSILVNEKKLQRPENKILLYFMVYTTFLWMIGMNLASVLRLAAYSEFFFCLYIPNVLGQIPGKSLRRAVQWCTCIVCIIVFQTIVLRPREDAISNVPYYFFWEDQPHI